MKFVSVRSRFHIGLLILLVLVFGSVVWARDVGTRLRCIVTDQDKASVGQAQLTSKSSNNAFGGRDAGVKMRESK